MNAEKIRVHGDMGNDFTVVVFRFGNRLARPKVYMQAAMHADELAGCLALDVLIETLMQSELEGLVVGEIVLVPFANPLGLAQSIAGITLGRFDLQGGSNFNLGWPQLVPSSSDSAVNGVKQRTTEGIRAEMAKVLRGATAATALGRLRLRLLEEAYDSDIALDLHSAPNTTAFAFTHSRNWPRQTTLASALNLGWVLCSNDSASTSFEDTLTAPWLAEGADPDVPQGCIACTVELQNVSHSHEQQAEINAAGLYLYLKSTGAVFGVFGSLPGWNGRAVLYNDVISITAERGGLLILRVNIGDLVSEGQVVAEILDPCPVDPRRRRRDLVSPCAGVVLMTAMPGALVAAGYTAYALVPTAKATALVRNYVDVGGFG